MTRGLTGVARFRGVAFHVTNAERSGGRRGSLDEYPGKDTPAFQDMGRKARPFSVEGFVVGDDYLVQHKKLIDALETEGPGELIHPFYETLQVTVRGFNVRLSVRDGGIASFTIDFIETPAQNLQPTAIPDAAGKVASSALVARESVGGEFLAKFNSGPLLSSISDMVRAATLSINVALKTVDMEVQKLATLKRRLTDLDNAVDALVRAPENLLLDVAEMLDLVDQQSVLFALYSFDPGVRPPATTDNRTEEQTNFDATQRMLQRLAVVRAAELAPDQTYDSYEAAVVARDAIADLIDEQAELAADDTVPDLTQLRADLVKALPSDESNLPHLTTYTPRATTCSLALAQELYGDASFESELVSRNGSRYPGFLIGGVGLEVLDRG